MKRGTEAFPRVMNVYTGFNVKLQKSSISNIYVQGHHFTIQPVYGQMALTKKNNLLATKWSSVQQACKRHTKNTLFKRFSSPEQVK